MADGDEKFGETCDDVKYEKRLSDVAGTLQKVKDANTRSSVLKYLDTLEKEASTGNRVTLLNRMATDTVDERKEKTKWKTLFAVGAVGAILAILAMFGVVIWAINVTKEAKVNEDTMVLVLPGSNTTIKVGSADFTTQPASNGRRLSAGSGSSAMELTGPGGEDLYVNSPPRAVKNIQAEIPPSDGIRRLSDGNGAVHSFCVPCEEVLRAVTGYTKGESRFVAQTNYGDYSFEVTSYADETLRMKGGDGLFDAMLPYNSDESDCCGWFLTKDTSAELTQDPGRRLEIPDHHVRRSGVLHEDPAAAKVTIDLTDKGKLEAGTRPVFDFQEMTVIDYSDSHRCDSDSSSACTATLNPQKFTFAQGTDEKNFKEFVEAGMPVYVEKQLSKKGSYTLEVIVPIECQERMNRLTGEKQDKCQLSKKACHPFTYKNTGGDCEYCENFADLKPTDGWYECDVENCGTKGSGVDAGHKNERGQPLNCGARVSKAKDGIPPEAEDCKYCRLLGSSSDEGEIEGVIAGIEECQPCVDRDTGYLVAPERYYAEADDCRIVMELCDTSPWGKLYDLQFKKCMKNSKASCMKQCFPASAQVRLADGATKALEELGPNDLVETTGDFQELRFERVVYDFHRTMDAKQAVVIAEFLEIVHEAKTALRISPNHFLYALRDGKAELVLAESVSVGDTLLATTGADLVPSKVSTIRLVKDRGIYAPLTFSGRLVVDGVLVSSYAASSSIMAAAWKFNPSLPWEKMFAMGSAPFRYFYGYSLDTLVDRVVPAWCMTWLSLMISQPEGGRTSAATAAWSNVFDAALLRWMVPEQLGRDVWMRPSKLEQ